MQITIFPEINAAVVILLEKEQLIALQGPSGCELNALVDDCAGVSAISEAVAVREGCRIKYLNNVPNVWLLGNNYLWAIGKTTITVTHPLTIFCRVFRTEVIFRDLLNSSNFNVPRKSLIDLRDTILLQY